MMLSKQLPWGCIRAVLVMFLLALSSYSVSMSEYPCLNKVNVNNIGDVPKSNDSSMDNPTYSWLPNFNNTNSNNNENSGRGFAPNGISPQKDDQLPGWLVASCLKNMPPYLQAIYNRLFSGDWPRFSDRILLVGGKGTLKSVTVNAIAQSLKCDNETVEALSLFCGDQSDPTVSKLFASLGKNKKSAILLIKGLHKVFEGQTCQHLYERKQKVNSFFAQLTDWCRRSCRNIFTVMTSNDVDQYVSKNFGRPFILMPPLSSDQLYDAFNNIVVDKNEAINVDDGARYQVNSFLKKKVEGESRRYSVKDIERLINIATNWTYFPSGQLNNSNGVRQLTYDHVKQAIETFDDGREALVESPKNESHNKKKKQKKGGSSKKDTNNDLSQSNRKSSIHVSSFNPFGKGKT